MLSWDQWVALGAAVIGAGGLGAILTALYKPSSRADLIKAKAEAEKIAQETVSAAMSGFQGEIRRLQEKLDHQQSKIDAQDDRIESLERDKETCQAENRDLKQQLHSLEEILRKAGIPIPARELPGSFVVIEKDRTTVLKPKARGAK